MIEHREFQEIMARINNSPIWQAKTAEEISFDPTAVMCVAFYPTCDCGAPVLERLHKPFEPFLFVGTEYMEPCYECQVVSSD